MSKAIKAKQPTIVRPLSQLEKGLIAWNIILTVILLVVGMKVNLIESSYIPYLRGQLTAHEEEIEQNLNYIKMFHEDEIPQQLSLKDVSTEEERRQDQEKCRQDKHCRQMLKRYGLLD